MDVRVNACAGEACACACAIHSLCEDRRDVRRRRLGALEQISVLADETVKCVPVGVTLLARLDH
eukprot:scaffold33803_cov84-Isochrysis_galbana.AAC.1